MREGSTVLEGAMETCAARLGSFCLGTVPASRGYAAMIEGKVAFVCDECAKRMRKGRVR